MKYHISESKIKLRKYVVAVVMFNKRNRISYTSGRIYFYHKESVKVFIDNLPKSLEYKVITVDVYKAHEPDLTMDSKGTWCPYCQQWEYWVSKLDGYKHCPVCNISDGDYYVKTYNRLWHREGVGTIKDNKSKDKRSVKRRKK